MLQPLSLKVSSKKKSFNVTLIINSFLSKLIIKKHYTNYIRQLCIGKDQLISVKYRLNLIKVEN